MASFFWSPIGGSGSGSGVATYTNFAAFPPAATVPNGGLAIALDTNFLYESTGATWLIIAAPSTVISIGTFDSGTASANGAHIDGNSLVMQSATATVPGVVNIGTQTFAGVKTFNSLINANGGIDRSSAGTLSIGTTNASTINIGNAGATVNIQGSTIFENTTTLNVADPLITLNDGGGAGSGQNSGMEIEEAAVITGYNRTSLDRNSWEMKAPNTAGVATVTPGAAGITLNQSSHDPVTLTAVGSSPNANGASLSSQALTLQPANTTNPGVVTAVAQTFGGVKTFNNNPVMTAITSPTTGVLLINTTGSIQVPSGTDTLVARDTTDTLTNKSMSGSLNTFTNLDINGTTTGTLNISRGGTGQTTALAAFNALSPLTTNGDILYYNSANNLRLPIGTNGQILTVVAGLPAWTTATAGANQTLSNLTSPTSINQDLLPNANNTLFVGSNLLAWQSMFASTLKLTNASTTTSTTLASSQTANRTWTFPDASDTVLGTASSATVSNKTLDNTNTLNIKDTLFVLEDDAVGTKKAKFELSALVGTRTFTLPNADTTLADIDSVQTFTNKSISGATNTITNVSLTTGVTGTLPIANGGTNAVSAFAALQNLLPTQAGNTGKFLQTDGSSHSWQPGTANGVKNYLSKIRTSNSSTINPGNGDFETETTAGWSLGTTGTLTNGLPTGTPTFGSGASANLTITAAANQLAGSSSLSYASSTATTAGNMVASDVFFIDSSDQAKVLAFKFAYKAHVNPANGNWSGTSANSFAAAIYDVTNSVWIPVTGAFGMTQSSGVGYAVGNFQTASNTSQLRFVLYNANASAGAITVLFDDIMVTPQPVVQGTPSIDFTSFVPVISGAGTVTNSTAWWKRDGDKMEVHGKFTSGTVAATTFSIALPTGALDSTKLSTSGGGSIVGSLIQGPATASAFNPTTANGPWALLADTATSTTLIYITFTTSGGNYQKTNGNGVLSSNVTTDYRFVVPIAGWSSNVQMSNDTDTRVVAVKAYLSANSTGTTNGTVPFDTLIFDTHGAFNTGTFKYKVPVSGTYRIQFTGQGGAATNGTFQVGKNGAALSEGPSNQYIAALTGNATTSFASGSMDVRVVAGDELYIINNAAGTNLQASSTVLEISRLSGPSVIAASETVAARYSITTGQSVTTTATTIAFNVKDYDTHGFVSAGVITIPVSGKYQINASTNITGAATSNFSELGFYRDGALVSRSYNPTLTFSGGGVIASCHHSDAISFTAGQLLTVKINLGTSSASLTTAGSENFFSITRIGL